MLCNSLWTGSVGIAIKEQASAVVAALCRRRYHGLCSMRGANIYKRAMSPPLKALVRGGKRVP
jgi:hypothetical protein